MMNKKSQFSFQYIAYIILALIVIYLILLIPIPLFSSIRTQINYFLILIFWIVFQIALFFGYFELGTYAVKGINFIRFKIVNWSLEIRKYIIVHS